MESTFEPDREREMARRTEPPTEESEEARVEIPYQVKLDVFEGPLDLLLHLIRKNEVDIYNIPIALITEQYLATLDLMRVLNLDVAGEFVLMAATLAYIKSRTLLPPALEEDEEEGDPETDLIRQLLEYERFKDAAEKLEAMPQLRREVFVRGGDVADIDVPLDEQELAEVSVFELLDAFRRVWERAPTDSVHEITGEKITLREMIHQILERLEPVDGLTFAELLEGAASRQALVVTFLALLELARLRIIRIYQVTSFGTIRIQKAISTMPEDREAIARGLDVEKLEDQNGAESVAEGEVVDSAPDVEVSEDVDSAPDVGASEAVDSVPDMEASVEEAAASADASERTSSDDGAKPGSREDPGPGTDVREEGDDPEGES